MDFLCKEIEVTCCIIVTNKFQSILSYFFFNWIPLEYLSSLALYIRLSLDGVVVANRHFFVLFALHPFTHLVACCFFVALSLCLCVAVRQTKVVRPSDSLA